MSSFPPHSENIVRLREVGFDVTEYEGDEGYDSWNQDSLTYLLEEVLNEYELILFELKMLRKEELERNF